MGGEDLVDAVAWARFFDKAHQDSILRAMEDESVILSQRRRERAVLASVAQWKEIVELLEMYRSV